MVSLDCLLVTIHLTTSQLLGPGFSLQFNHAGTQYLVNRFIIRPHITRGLDICLYIIPSRSLFLSLDCFEIGLQGQIRATIWLQVMLSRSFCNDSTLLSNSYHQFFLTNGKEIFNLCCLVVGLNKNTTNMRLW